MARPVVYPKKISRTERVYYHFKIDATRYSLFDSAMDTPIAYGSYNFVSATIANLPATSTIFYFESDNRQGWKMARTYNPKKESVDTLSKSKAVDRMESKKRDLT